MRIVLSWLRDYVEIKESPKDLGHALTMAGLAVDAIEEHGEDHVFELDITSNRPDAMNHLGIAREISAIYRRPLKIPEIRLEESDIPVESAASVEIIDDELCPRYVGRVLQGVKIAPAPDWMRRRLELCEVRSINNIADLTNYVLLEVGQPTHAFDLDKLDDGKIVVRKAALGEALVTLDGEQRKLSPADLAICDSLRPIALAGVMGGADSEISESTTNVLIEAAWFKPSLIRNMSRRFKMHTEASHRFERGADWNAAPWAADRIAGLLAQVGGGTVLKGRLDCYPQPRQRPLVELRSEAIARHLGLEIPGDEVTAMLEALGFEPKAIDGGWSMEAPSARLDVEREIDLIEEVARVYGFDRFPSTLPAIGAAIEPPPFEKEEAAVRSTVQSLGYDETIGYSFIASDEAEQFGGPGAIPLRNPLSEVWDVMRNSAAPTMLRSVEWNLNRSEPVIRLAEFGRIYERTKKGFQEPRVLTLGLSGMARPDSLHEAGRSFQFADLKADVAAVLKRFDIAHLVFETKGLPSYYRKGHSAVAVGDGMALAYLGELDPEVAKVRKIRQAVFVGEIFLDLAFRQGLRHPRHRSLPKVPAVSRDFSLLVPEGVQFAEISAAIGPMEHLISIAPVEIFRGKNVAAGFYSLLLRASWQQLEESFTDGEVNTFAETIRSSLQKKLGITQRQ